MSHGRGRVVLGPTKLDERISSARDRYGVIDAVASFLPGCRAAVYRLTGKIDFCLAITEVRRCGKSWCRTRGEASRHTIDRIYDVRDDFDRTSDFDRFDQIPGREDCALRVVAVDDRALYPGRFRGESFMPIRYSNLFCGKRSVIGTAGFITRVSSFEKLRLFDRVMVHSSGKVWVEVVECLSGYPWRIG